MSSVYFVAIIITTQDGPGKCFGFHSNRKQKPLQHSDCLNDVKIKIYSPIDASYSMSIEQVHRNLRCHSVARLFHCLMSADIDKSFEINDRPTLLLGRD